MESHHPRPRTYGSHQYSLPSIPIPVTELDSAGGATCLAHLGLPNEVSRWRRRPLHLYGSRTTVVGWPEIH